MARYRDVFSDNYLNRIMKQWGLEDNLARVIKRSLKNEMIAYGRKLEGVINELNMLHARCVVKNEPIPKEELGKILDSVYQNPEVTVSWQDVPVPIPPLIRIFTETADDPYPPDTAPDDRVQPDCPTPVQDEAADTVPPSPPEEAANYTVRGVSWHNCYLETPHD